MRFMLKQISSSGRSDKRTSGLFSATLNALSWKGDRLSRRSRPLRRKSGKMQPELQSCDVSFATAKTAFVKSATVRASNSRRFGLSVLIDMFSISSSHSAVKNRSSWYAPISLDPKARFLFICRLARELVVLPISHVVRRYAVTPIRRHGRNFPVT